MYTCNTDVTKKKGRKINNVNHFSELNLGDYDSACESNYFEFLLTYTVSSTVHGYEGCHVKKLMYLVYM